MGSNIFRQIVGVPIGVDPVPLLLILRCFIMSISTIKLIILVQNVLIILLCLLMTSHLLIQMVCFKNILKVYILIA